MARPNIIEQNRQLFLQQLAHERETATEITEELSTDDLRFLDGVLQRKYIIRVHRGMDVISMTDEWRDIPTVTTT